MFNSLETIKRGNAKQRYAYAAITKLSILEDLKVYSPTLCGTIPLNVDTEESDLDIILNVKDLNSFEVKMNTLYETYFHYNIKRKLICKREVLVTSFYFDGFEFQLFAQNQSTLDQYAYLHMIVEWKTLEYQPALQSKIRKLKKQGMKTEPAFCHLLGLKGDPYEALLKYGKQKGFI